jgi:hypothetical protein
VALGLPARLDQVLSQAHYGDLTTQAMLAPDSARALRRIERSVERLTWMVVAIGLLVSGMLLRTTDGPGWPSTGLFVLAGLAVLWGATRR